ncbi:MAG: tetratricopeptide repeat protein, partial [Bacteroidetes bacterium]|nr:tetratricopeptide repeat protein [Bacteroidota bacterium]
QVRQMLGDYIAAEVLFRKAISVDSLNSVLYARMGNLMQTKGRYSESEDWYRKSLSSDSSNAYANLCYGQLYADYYFNYERDVNYLKPAGEHFFKAIEADEFQADNYIALGKFYLKCIENLVVINFRETGNTYENATDLITEPSDRGEGGKYFDRTGPSLLVVEKNQYDNLLKNNDTYNNIAGIFKKALKLDPYAEEAYSGLALAGKLFGRSDSEKLLNEAIGISPAFPQPYYNLASYHEDNKDWNEAAKYYESALKKDPRFLPAYRRLFIVYAMLGSEKKATELYKQGSRNFPKTATISYSYGLFWYNSNNAKKAKQYLNEALKYDAGYNYAATVLNNINKIERAGSMSGNEIQYKFDSIVPQDKGVVKIKSKGREYDTDITCRIGKPELIEDMELYNDQCYIIRQNGKYGLMSPDYKILAPACYDEFKKLGVQVLAVRRSNAWGCVSAEGKEVVPFKYSRITDGEYSKVLSICCHLGSELVFYDKDGNCLSCKHRK